jgi:hypothetical protein
VTKSTIAITSTHFDFWVLVRRVNECLILSRKDSNLVHPQLASGRFQLRASKLCPHDSDNREIRVRLDKQARRDRLEIRASREIRAKPAIADERETGANRGRPHHLQRVSTNTRIRTMAERLASWTKGRNGNFCVAKRA